MTTVAIALFALAHTGDIGRSILEFGAHSITEPGKESFDSTAAIQKAVDTCTTVLVPAGVYLVDPSVGIRLNRSYVSVMGEGWGLSVLRCKPTGGSLFRRDWNPSAKNPYVFGVSIRRIGVELESPTPASPSNPVNIAFDLRNITRSLVEDCYAGNFRTSEIGGKRRFDNADYIQGIAFLFGNVPASSPGYCGGEGNQAVRCRVFGARKGFDIDDAELSPRSGAHATLITDCEVQFCESGISQESRYTAATHIRNPLVQAVFNAKGSDKDTVAVRMDGYDGMLTGGYLEEKAKRSVWLGPQSHGNTVTGVYIANKGRTSDDGKNNRLEGG
ncbi:MAG: hypothetical protein KF857_00695 [Fimbriimonadaceae bacterium]|nr:hypothetical protein [Fimbriimonadaceae bacterium]